MTSCSPQKSAENITSEPLKNWAESFEFSTGNVHYPKTMKEVQALVLECNNLRVLGSKHSFNKIADSKDNLISLQNLNKIVFLDRDKKQVIVEGGIKYGDLCAYLHENGYALHNLASLPHISVAGTIATATHGSGVENGNLSTWVAALEFINANGELIQLSRGFDSDFFGAVVGLGGLGPVTKVTLDLFPTFEVAQVVYMDMPMEALKDNFQAIMSAGYSVSLFIDWKSDKVNEVWVKRKILPFEAIDFPKEFFGAKQAKVHMHPVQDMSAECCSEQLAIPGPWYERLPHFKMEFQPSAGKELQSEYFVPFENGYAAVMAVAEIAAQIHPHLFISEIRSIKADDLWMSNCYQRDSIAIHTTWKQDIPEVIALLPKMEAKLERFNPRPHWAKLFTISNEKIYAQYPKIEEFKSLLAKHDPEGKFRNEFLDEHIFGGQ